MLKWNDTTLAPGMKRTDAKQARNQTECLAFICSRRNTHLDINLKQYPQKIQHYKFGKGRKRCRLRQKESQYRMKKKRKTFRREKWAIVDITLDNVWCADRVENADVSKAEVPGDLVQIGFRLCEAFYLVTHELVFKRNKIWKKELWFVFCIERMSERTSEVLK